MYFIENALLYAIKQLAPTLEKLVERRKNRDQQKFNKEVMKKDPRWKPIYFDKKQYPVNEEVDDLIFQMINDNTAKLLVEYHHITYTGKHGSYRIWICNYPFAYGNIYHQHHHDLADMGIDEEKYAHLDRKSALPSVKARLALNDFMMRLYDMRGINYKNRGQWNDRQAFFVDMNTTGTRDRNELKKEFIHMLKVK